MALVRSPEVCEAPGVDDADFSAAIPMSGCKLALNATRVHKAMHASNNTMHFDIVGTIAKLLPVREIVNEERGKKSPYASPPYACWWPLSRSQFETKYGNQFATKSSTLRLLSSTRYYSAAAAVPVHVQLYICMTNLPFIVNCNRLVVYLRSIDRHQKFNV